MFYLTKTSLLLIHGWEDEKYILGLNCGIIVQVLHAYTVYVHIQKLKYPNFNSTVQRYALTESIFHQS